MELIVAVLKWLQLAGLAAMTGPALFDFIWRRAGLQDLQREGSSLAPRLNRLAIWGAAFLLAAAVAQPFLQAAVAGGVSLVWAYLTSTLLGRALAVRILAAIAVLLVALSSPTGQTPAPNRGRQAAAAGWPLWVLLLAAVAATSFTFLSHQASGGWLPTAFDFLHTLGTTIWAAGLLALSIQPWNNGKAPVWRPAAIPMIVEFSGLATAAILAVTVSGIYAAVTNVGALPALTGTPYGETLLVKLVLFAALAAVAAVNHFWLVPRLHRSRSTPSPHDIQLLSLLVRIEAGLILGVLFFASLLSSLPPPVPFAGGA